MAVLKFVSLVYLVTVCVDADPCDTAELRDAQLRSSDNLYNPEQTSLRFCDNTLPEGWYKFEDNGIPADIPISAPYFGSCNTFFPAYLDGQLPQAVGQQVNIDACVRGMTLCSSRYPIQIKKCDGFNVYFLKPLISCPSAYCFDTAVVAGPCPPGQSSETGDQPGCTANFPVINENPAVQPGLISGRPDKLFFVCTVANLNAAFFYDIVWFANDVEVHRYTGLSAVGLPASARLLEEHWTSNFRLGINVKCAIRARFTSKATPSPERSSPVFFAGIKIIGDPAIHLVEGEKKVVKCQSTIPIPCFLGFPCALYLNVLKIGSSCSGEKDKCSVQIQNTNWDAMHEFTITGTHDGLYGDQVAQFILKGNPPIPGLQTLWDKFETTPIQVNILDTDKQVASSRCDIHNDPHLTTFDNKRFDVHLHGEFILYRHKTLPYEVRGFFQQCYDGSVAHCVCGVAVRSGSQYFVWTRCRDNQFDESNVAFQTSRINVYGCSARHLRVTTDNNGRVYKVKVPSGLEVTIDTGSRSILIVPSAADREQTEGLCGNFNGDDTDEFISPNGTLYSNDCERYLFNSPSIYCMVPTYSITWRVSNILETLYNGLMVDHLGTPVTAHCYCAKDENNNDVINCENKPPVGCEAGLSPEHVTDQYCTQLSKRRRKRSLPLLSEPIAIFPPAPPESGPPSAIDLWPNGWTEQTAEQHCRAEFDKLKFVQACRKIPNLKEERMIESCIADIALSGNTEWTAVTTEAYKVQCLTEVAKNASLWKDVGQGQTVLRGILDVSCPGECSGNGDCVKGQCECIGQWLGPDCGVNGNTAPGVALLEPFGGLCDLSEEDCREVVVRGGIFVKSPSLRCHFTSVNVSGVEFYVSSAIYRHSSEVVCRLPEGVIDTSGVGYIVSVSNHNDQFGSGKLFLPFDSGCFSCFLDKDSKGVCKLQDNFCYLENTCVAEGSSSPSGKKCVKGEITQELNHEAKTDQKTPGIWTDWMWRDSPSGSGDFEERALLKPIPCEGVIPPVVDVRVKGTTSSVLTTSDDRQYKPGEQGLTQFVRAGPVYGFACYNKKQISGQRCKDYEVRFLCRYQEPQQKQLPLLLEPEQFPLLLESEQLPRLEPEKSKFRLQ